MSEDEGTLRILNLEDEPLDTELIHAALSDGGLNCEILRVQTRGDFAAALENDDFDLILADYSLPSFDGLSALKIVRGISPEMPFILVSGAIGEERAIEALKSGATDYVLKQRLERLGPVVRRAVREAEERTERKQTEEALQRLKHQHELILNSAGEGILGMDPQGNATFINPAGVYMTGRDAGELLGRPVHEALHHSRPDGTPYPWEECPTHATLIDGKVHRLTNEVFWRKDGTNFPVEYVSAPIRENGEVVGAVMVFKDITERKEAEEALREVQEAERSRLARDLHDGALQSLSYGLQQVQLIQRVFGNAGLNETLDRGEVLKQATAALQRSVQELRGAIYDLRLEEERYRPLPKLVKSLVELNQRMVPDCDIHLEVEERFPSSPLGERDSELLRIVQEALTNARRHSGAQNVLVELGAEGDKIWVEVSDNGRGIGTQATAGVGLKSMRERAGLLGGDLKIESELGKGTRVRLEVALERENGKQLKVEEEIRVLLVEDHASFREAATSVFEREQWFEVVGEADSLSEARRMLDGDASKVDVAIIDLGLPDGYGGELITELREKNPQAQALVLSSSLDRREIARAVEYGAAGVLHKSVGMDEVVEAVRRLRAGEALLPLEEVVELLRFASSNRAQEQEARRAIEQLTLREKEVLQALAEGLDGPEIAERLTITIPTERNHMMKIFAKLGVHSRLQALVFALRHRIVEIGR